jgi:hypothetical protein
VLQTTTFLKRELQGGRRAIKDVVVVAVVVMRLFPKCGLFPEDSFD